MKTAMRIISRKDGELHDVVEVMIERTKAGKLTASPQYWFDRAQEWHEDGLEVLIEFVEWKENSEL